MRPRKVTADVKVLHNDFVNSKYNHRQRIRCFTTKSSQLDFDYLNGNLNSIVFARIIYIERTGRLEMYPSSSFLAGIVVDGDNGFGIVDYA
jgi:hypothetical protein